MRASRMCGIRSRHWRSVGDVRALLGNNRWRAIGAACERYLQPADAVRSSSWVLARLGQDTRQLHVHADTDRLAVIDCPSDDAYRRYLARVHGFESAVVLAVAPVDGLAIAGAGAWLRLERLRQDLIALGVPQPMALPHAGVHIKTSAQALGWLFVIERHVLLAGLVRRILEAQLPEVAHASRYFATHPEGGSRVRAFGDVLAECVRDGAAHPDAICSAAAYAFEMQHQWYARMSLLRARTASEPYRAITTARA